jgi:subtilisin family serine protease
MEREYVVVVNRGVDLAAFDAEMAASQGHGAIPGRSVDVADPRLGSRRMTHWMITDAEAEQLRLDPRVLSVEIPVDQRTDVQIGKTALQTDTFYRGNDGLATGSNWGLRRCNETTNTYANNTTITDDAGFAYALDGTGVDIVIQDSGIEPLHPEWNDKNGNSRLQQIDWGSDDIWGVGNAPFTQNANHYRDYDGHGTHVASTAAGLTYGWAKGAHIYSQKLNGLEGTVGGNDSGTGIPIANAFDAIRLWHLAKTNGRPTVVNMSWGYSTGVTGAPDSGNYRGGAWTYSSETANDLWDTYGLVADENLDNTGSRSLPVQIASVDAEIEDMLDAGIHICIAAGNDYYKADIPAGADYDNTITFGGTTRFYHRPSSPFADGVFLVGNIESTTFNNGGTYLDRTRGSSKKGPAVNIWAPGTNIKAAMSVINDGGTTYDYPANTSYKIQYLNGTSMSSPQVAGVLALHLQSLPNLSPADLRNRIFSDSASDVIYTTANNDTDYRAFTTSILGAQNRFLYNRYNRQNPWTITRT